MALPAFRVRDVSDPPNQTKRCRCTSDNEVKEGDIVVIPKNVLSGTPPSRIGLSYGTLLVPYKYHLEGSKNFTGNATVGGYIGYRHYLDLIGLEMQYVCFLGAAPISVDITDANGETSSQTLFGVSYGVGILGKVKNSFNIGAVFGADKVNDSTNYISNGKPWIAVEIGYSFSK
jgi:hypothetical protein